MSTRTFVSWLRRRGLVIALPLVAGLSPLALAQTAAADTIYTPTTAAQLQADVTAANAAGGFNIIELSGGYAPSAPITVTSHLEITGPPQATATVSHNYTIAGTAVSPSTSDTITAAPGANLILKAFDLINCGKQDPTIVNACVHVNNGANVEFDNMSVVNPQQFGINVDAGGTATLNNSSVIAGEASAINVAQPQGTTVGTLTLNNATVAQMQKYDVIWTAGDNITFNNSILAQADQAAATNPYEVCYAGQSTIGGPNPVPTAAAPKDISSMDDDGSCRVTHSADSYINLPSSPTYGQGPTELEIPGQGDGTGQSDVQGAGNFATCQNDDQTFYLLSSTTTCDDGAYQSSTTKDSTVSGPTCTVKSVSETPPATMVVDTQSTVPGQGPDAIFAPETILKSTQGSSSPTPNGVVSWPTISGTLFDETNPNGAGSPAATGANGQPILLDEPSTGAFPVTDQKPSSDNSPGDTYWQFDAMDWLGNTTLCK